MHIKKVSLTSQRLLVISPIYNKIEKLYAIQNLLQPNDHIVFLGDICHPYKSTTEIVKRVNTLQAFSENKKFYYVLGDYDLTLMPKIINTHLDMYNWLNVQDLGVKFTYENNTSILVFHGGLLPKHKSVEDLNNDLEISFVNDNKWHKKYKGQLGYIVTSHPSSSDNKVKIYNHSISLDTKCHETDILAVQEITNKGLGQTFYL